MAPARMATEHTGRDQLMSDVARRIISAAGEGKAGSADVLPAVAVHDS